MKRFLITSIILSCLSIGQAYGQFSGLIRKAIQKQAQVTPINKIDPNKPDDIKKNSLSIEENCYVARLAKPGKLKSLITDDMDITKLVIYGVINEKDIETAKSIPNLRSLDLRNVGNSKLSFDMFDKLKIQLSCSLDTLFLPNVVNLECAESRYWNILPRFVVSEEIAYINSDFDGRKDFKDVQGFPEIKYGRQFSVPDTLDLSSAIVVNNFFGNQRDHYAKVKFGKNLRYIDNNAFNIRGGIDILEFADGSNPTIKVNAFKPRGDSRTSLPRIKMARVPKGSIDLFKSLDFPEWILVDSDPVLEYNIDIQTPGTLEQSLIGKNLKLISKLKITGKLDFQDIRILQDIYFIRSLDLSDAIVCMSEADRQKEISDLEGQAAMANLMSEGQYQRDGNRLGRNVRNKLIQAGEEAIEDKKNEKLPEICEIPGGAFWGLDLLQVLALPKTLANIRSHRYHELITSKNLKVIWVGKEAYSKLPLDWIKSQTNAEIRTY